MSRVSPLACLALLMALGACTQQGERPEPSAGGGGETGTLAAVLEPASDTLGHIVVGDSRVYYTAFGEGKPVVIIHGGPGLDQGYMRPWLDGLADFSRAVYYDQRGTGGSTGPLTPEEINFDQFVDDLDHIRSTMGFEKISLLGHSWGGLLAMAYALEQPERVERMILMSTAEPGLRFAAQAQLKQRETRTTEDNERLQELVRSEAYAAGDPAAVSEIFKIAFRSTLADRSDVEKLNLELSEATAKNRDQVTTALQQNMVQPEWWDDLARLAVPTLVVHGRHDPTPVEMAQELADSLPNAQLLILRDSGHFPFVEEPEPVMEALRGFLTASGPG